MKKPIFLPKLQKLVATFGTLPTSYKTAMTYEEQIIWICNYMETELLPALNQNAAALKELQDLFVLLKEYVDNYFENLDLQEEVDNKINEMVESGELQEIIIAYLQTNGVLGFNTKTDMKAATNLIDGSICKTLGNTNYITGDGHIYKIRELLNTDVIDDINIIALTNYPDLIAELIPDKYINDLNDDITQINNSIDLANGRIDETNARLDDGIVVLLGDSYGVRNATSWYSWGDKLAAMRNWTHSVDYFNFCTGNSGLTVTNNNYYINLINNESVITDKTKVKTFIIAGGYNDNYYMSGSNSDSEYETRLAELVTYIKNNYVNAKIYMGFIGNSNALNGTGMRNVMINNALKGYSKIQNYDNCYYMNNVECVMHRYDYFISDNTHPNENGARMLAHAINQSVYGAGYTPIFNRANITFSNVTINVAQIATNLEISITGSCYPVIATSAGMMGFETSYTIDTSALYLRSNNDTYTRIPFVANAAFSDNSNALINGQIRIKSSDGIIIFDLEISPQLANKSIQRLDFKYKPVLLPIIYF